MKTSRPKQRPAVRKPSGVKTPTYVRDPKSEKQQAPWVRGTSHDGAIAVALFGEAQLG